MENTKNINKYLKQINTSILKDSITLYDLLKRPEVKIEHLTYFIDIPFNEEEKEYAEINIRYEGYIKKANHDVEKMLQLENKKIPENINYQKIKNLASEAREKLEKIRPTSLGQASRISGVNPADIGVLMVYLKRNEKND